MKKMTNPARTIDVLNRLVALHARSLPMYLADAHPWTPRADEADRDVLTQIAADQTAVVQRLASLIIEQGGSVHLGDFPMHFTGQHDLALGYLVHGLVAHQRETVAAIEECVQQLEHDPMAKAVAQETLGEAKGHLELLQELARDDSIASATS